MEQVIMVWFRAIFEILICGGLAGWLMYHVVTALRTGRLRHTDSQQYFDRDINPVKYWGVLSVFSVFIMALLYPLIMMLEQK